METMQYRITTYDPAKFSAELQFCFENRNGPSRHPAEYVLSHPDWRESRGFCTDHLNKTAEEDPNLKAAWQSMKKL